MRMFLLEDEMLERYPAKAGTWELCLQIVLALATILMLTIFVTVKARVATVDVAERLEKLTKQSGTPVVVSQDLLKAAGEAADPPTWRKLPVLTLKGRLGEVVAYGLETAGSIDRQRRPDDDRSG